MVHARLDPITPGAAIVGRRAGIMSRRAMAPAHRALIMQVQAIADHRAIRPMFRRRMDHARLAAAMRGLATVS